MTLASRLPDFPWDRLAPFGATARSHADGIVDLSIGTPVDPVPQFIQDALRVAGNAHGYPLTAGTAEFREAVAAWAKRRLNSSYGNTTAVLPTIGSKELVALLPSLLDLGPQDSVVVPSIAYPTYVVGAQIANCTVLVSDDPNEWDASVRLIWLNSPSNPTGAVASVEHLRNVVAKARELNAVVVSDECYIELGWDTTPTSILSDDVTNTNFANVLAVHSLSKRSNLAGYRVGSVMGDATLVQQLLEARKHIGLMVPAPVLSAGALAIADDAHVAEQRARYASRRSVLMPALKAAGFDISHSNAGLYLWATRGEDCWTSVAWLAQRGILVAPGEFYGEAGRQHVRVALTASDERIHAAVARLTS